MKYFEDSEFACKHCGKNEMKQSFLFKLKEARRIADTSFVLSSAYRCDIHNANVGGVKGSSHTKGYAVDIRVTDDRKRFKVIAALMEVGFNRIGVSGNFIHVDNDPSKSEDVIWTY